MQLVHGCRKTSLEDGKSFCRLEVLTSVPGNLPTRCSKSIALYLQHVAQEDINGYLFPLFVRGCPKPDVDCHLLIMLKYFRINVLFTLCNLCISSVEEFVRMQRLEESNSKTCK